MHLDRFSGDTGAPHAPDQLLGLATEHAAADHFDVPGMLCHALSSTGLLGLLAVCHTQSEARRAAAAAKKRAGAL